MTSGNFRPLRPVRALSHPTNTPQMPSMSSRAHLGWIRNLVFQGIVRCTLPTKVPLMVNPYYKPYTMVFVGYIPWVYTVRGYTQKCPLEFFRDTTKPRGASQNDPHPLHWKMFVFCQPKKQYKETAGFLCRSNVSKETLYRIVVVREYVAGIHWKLHFCIWEFGKKNETSKTWNNSLNTFL